MGIGFYEMHRLGPWTAAREAQGSPKKSITPAVSMSNGIGKGTPNLKKGEEIFAARGIWGKGEKLPKGNGSNLEC